MSKPGQLRLIAGQWRGRMLDVADVPDLRPTPNRVRETLFNWLAPDIAQLRVLDLFAGTGVLGFEALSRGAAHVTFVEQNPQAFKALQANARSLKIDAQQIQLCRGDALRQLARLDGFDLIFVDPPFQADMWQAALEVLPAHLNAGHRVYLESPRNWPLPDAACWQILKEKSAADVTFRLLAYSAP